MQIDVNSKLQWSCVYRLRLAKLRHIVRVASTDEAEISAQSHQYVPIGGLALGGAGAWHLPQK